MHEYKGIYTYMPEGFLCHPLSLLFLWSGQCEVDLPEVLWEGTVGGSPGNYSLTSSAAVLYFNLVPLSKQALWITGNSGQQLGQ